MSALTLSPIWGEELDTQSSHEIPGHIRQPDETPISQQILCFIQAEIALFRPDVVIVHERKGTAIVRSLIESPRSRLNWPWERVLSSSALDSIPSDYLRNKRLLVFDDMLRTGQHLASVAQTLKKRGIWDGGESVRFAVFAKHEDSSRHGTTEGHLPHSWFYSDLTTPAFQMLRRKIVKMLQEAGSLMLDTEHIEVRFRLKTGLARLVNALQRRADVMVFRSLANRTNITVYYDDDDAHSLPRDEFPLHTDFTRIVKKCRIVQRDGDEFAIIPLCLPSVATNDTNWPVSEDVKDLLGASVTESKFGRFYGVAILGSLHPLEWILKDLYAAEPGLVDISLPSKSSTDIGKSGYTLDHLRVMFPTLRVEALVDRITAIASSALAQGRKLYGTHSKQVAQSQGTAPNISNDVLHRDALHLLQAIGNTIDRRAAEHALVEMLQGTSHAGVAGLCAREIFEIGTNVFKWEPVRVSTLFDILIDDANLVTRVEEKTDSEGCRRFTRTFKPDGEVVSDLLRRYTTQWGLPYGN